MKKIIAPFVLLLSIHCAQHEASPLEQLAKLPKGMKEISGIAYHHRLLYSIEDSGNENEVTVMNTSGTIVNRIAILHTPNVDWEDLTFDTQGNLYIGDFGNNDNTRRDLAIYKIDRADLKGSQANVAYTLTFDYPEQTEFPPKKNHLLFDVEAFLAYQNDFYLFTKNRSKGFDGTSYIYKIPNTPGHHHAQFVKKITTCTDYHHCAITSASISPDASRFVLLSHSKLWLFTNYTPGNLTDGRMTELNLNHYSQKEALCFKNNDTLLIADERVKNTGGNLYQVSLKALK